MRSACTLILLFWSLATAAVEVLNVRSSPAAEGTRVVFDMSTGVRYRVFTLAEPEHRVIIDIQGARMRGDAPPPAADDRLLAGIRWSTRNQYDLRLVLDLLGPAETNVFQLPPSQDYGHRLVVDLAAVGPAPHARPSPPVAQAPPPATLPAAPAPKAELARPPVEARSAAPAPRLPSLGLPRDVVIAIDPGHGGEDPGAIGLRGNREKDVVLAISRRLADLINRERGMRAVLTRDGDYYLGLRERMQRARAHKADLFISIHADAFKDPKIQGSSVYVLSRRGASSEAARWLAERENAADLIGGVSLEDKDELLASVLLDLSQTGTLEASIDLASRVLKDLKRVGKVHKNQVQHAGFMVLKSPDIPSVLVETAFISNPHEELKLIDRRHQQSLAEAILAGVRSYFRTHAPPGTLLAMREHVISKGETLSTIASQYQLSADVLRMANGLSDDQIRAGDVLRIPETGG